jgi:hypothetical protein
MITVAKILLIAVLFVLAASAGFYVIVFSTSRDSIWMTISAAFLIALFSFLIYKTLIAWLDTTKALALLVACMPAAFAAVAVLALWRFGSNMGSALAAIALFGVAVLGVV